MTVHVHSTPFAVGCFSLGVFFSAAIGCSSDGGPQASGTKTDWLIVCDDEADCDAEPGLGCLCGICTVVCSSDADCQKGVCGSEIATSATCGSDHELSAAEERICVPESDVCSVATVSQESGLGEAEPVVCENAGALLCEGFEGRLPEAYSTWGDGESSTGLSECLAQQGSGALRIDAIDDGYTQTRMRLETPVSTGEIHARFYLRVEEGSTFPDQLIVFELWDQEEGNVAERTTVYLNQEQVLEVYLGAANLTLPADPMEPLQLDVWNCVELKMSLDDAAGMVSLSLAGTPIASATEVDTMPSDPISVVVLEGVPTQGSQNTKATVYFDDLIVGTAAIGCD